LRRHDAVSRALHGLALVFALAGAALALAVAAMVVISIVGRAGFDAPISGDVELTQVGIALALSLGLPWCQWRRANIVVDYFTQKLPEQRRLRLDAVGSVLIALMCALLAWRSAAGALAVRQAQESTMILALPMWWVYASLAPGLALAAVIALWQGQGQWRGIVMPCGAGATEAD
jgi:TRAP-type C4-dicarboxylate transport system permease small subunit